ncbi:glutathione S-transferase family protein [Stappia sp. F7233]|uniref:Glutathione S-transferase family protein n=1 Tax=Stappia albiluteola TaxID=2758565 RepID=A0A839AGB4_9HYPH|nr:glutathione S-transferase family protein [Stappia albiluteola]MBA5777974.1 glutathione S-transferase family protein [Stappia albiluteola]
MRIIIGNKTYSSWSLRAWLAVRLTGEVFEEELVPLDTPEFAATMRSLSPAGKVPTLIDGDITVWDSLAIVEYLAETYPDAGLWPKDRAARAHARAITAEMHSGFMALRSGYPMNFRRHGQARKNPPDASRDIERISAIWREARECFGDGGAFLFGAFSAADCFYAPVVNRFLAYDLPLGPIEKAYAEAVYDHPYMLEWRDAASREEWVVHSDEVE